MFRSLLLGLGLLSLVGAVWAAAPPPADTKSKAPPKAKSVKPKSVKAKDASSPIRITITADGMGCWVYSAPSSPIAPGSVVVWHNGSNAPHTATSDDGTSFDTGRIDPGQDSQPQTMPAAGTYSYHCNFHGCMQGSLTVGSGPLARPAGKIHPAEKAHPAVKPHPH
jgi:plastocyanin